MMIKSKKGSIPLNEGLPPKSDKPNIDFINLTNNLSQLKRIVNRNYYLIIANLVLILANLVIQIVRILT